IRCPPGVSSPSRSSTRRRERRWPGRGRASSAAYHSTGHRGPSWYRRGEPICYACVAAAPLATRSGRPPTSSSSSAAHERSATRTLVRRHRLPRAELPLDLPRDVHRAELRPAHRAELGALEVLRRQRFIVQLTRALRIERQPELLVPVERVPRARQRVVPVAGTRPAARDVGGVRRDLVGDHALAHLL